MARQRRARRAAQHDPRYSGQKHEAAVHQRRLVARMEREKRIKLRKTKRG